MRRSQGGYTIVEAMVALAIAGVLLASAMVLLRGLNGETEFSQAMHDIDSKIQTVVGAINGGLFPDTTQYKCDISLSTDRPVLTKLVIPPGSNQDPGTNQDCLFLGKALQVVPTQPKLYIYSVLGDRTYKINASGQRAPVTSFEQANAEPAIASGTDLTEDYTFSSSAAILKSSTVSGSAAETDLIGFYNSLQTSGTTRSGIGSSLLAKNYNLQTNTIDPRAGVQACIEGQSTCTSAGFSQWNLCFETTDHQRTAQLVVNVSSTGIKTQLNFVGC